MTAVLPRAPRDRGGADRAALAPARRYASPARSRTSWFARHPEWPVTALLVGWPVWWIVGIEDYVILLLAIPMLAQMYRWRATRTRRIMVPPAFGLWLGFLAVAVIAVVALSLSAPDTITSSVSNRTISWLLRTLSYFALTVLLLYVGNLTEEELPRRRLAWMLGLVGIYGVIGGIGGIIIPHVRFTSPLLSLVPASISTSNGQLFAMMHPGFSEVQGFLGYAEGRPMAPFDYTNQWGDCLAILLPWLLAGWWFGGTRRQRRAALVFLVLAFAPIIYSLDRGLWVGVGCTVLYLALRFAARGKFAMLGILVGTLAVVGLVVAATPLQSLISQRLDHGASNKGRLSVTHVAIMDGLSSPFIGYGDTRHQAGSAASIAVGKKASCANCGNSTVGGNGQLWLLVESTGFLGAALYVGFFGYAVWRFRRDHTPYGMAGVLVILLGFVFMLVYTAVGPPLVFTVLAYILLWRNDMEWRKAGSRGGMMDSPRAGR